MHVSYGFLLFIQLATAMDYAYSSLVAILVRAQLCRLLLQSRDEAKRLPHPQHTTHLWSKILIKNLSNKGRSSHFTSSLDWSKNLPGQLQAMNKYNCSKPYENHIKYMLVVTQIIIPVFVLC